jgi:hypothetical protein
MSSKGGEQLEDAILAAPPAHLIDQRQGEGGGGGSGSGCGKGDGGGGGEQGHGRGGGQLLLVGVGTTGLMPPPSGMTIYRVCC